MKLLNIVAVLLLSTSSLFAQYPIEKLNQAFQNLVNDEQAKFALPSLCVLDAKTGKTIFAKNEDIGLATASTLKTITSATAFYMLGKDFRYQTTIGYEGKIEADGTLNGNIIILGSGDPTLGSWRYANTKEHQILSLWVEAIKSAGIKKITGQIIGDDRLFGTQSTPEGWIWQDLGNYYGAGTSSLSWRENQFDLNLKPGSKEGSPVTIKGTSPTMPYLQIVNELSTGASGTGDNAYAFLPPYANQGYVRGSWGLGIGKSGISLASPDPAFDVAYRLQDTLTKLNIQSLGATTARRMALNDQKAPELVQKLYTHQSPTLSEIVYWFNKKSINLYGEQLLKTIALKSGKEATTANGVNTEVKFWSSKGLDKRALNIFDGSGLSPATRVTTAAMANLLFQVQTEPWFADYLNSFPENNGMKIKSGSIKDVSAYAGYYTASNGNSYVVVININNYNGSGISRKLFKVLDALK